MTNEEIATTLSHLADLLEIEGSDSHRVRAYRDAAQAIRDTSTSLPARVQRGEGLEDLPFIGESLAGKIEELVRTGRLEQLEELEQRIPPSLADLLQIEGLGGKRVKRLYEELGITSLAGLEQAAREKQISALEGFGPKLEAQILAEVERSRGKQGRTPLSEIEPVAERLRERLQGLPGVEQVTVAGSYRRRKETVGDLDLVATARDSRPVMEAFTGDEQVERVVSRGPTRSSVRLKSGQDVDLRVVAAESYGAALFYFTGSRAHNLHLRKLAIERGWKINEYGVYDGERKIAGETEEDLYRAFDLPWFPPELRENRGEIEAAFQGRLPQIVERDQIRGDLQAHTTASDGRASLEEMAAAARELGYRYLAITDHIQAQGIIEGLDPAGLRRQMESIDRLNEGFQDFRLLKGAEVDILEDGDLALPEDLRAELEVVLVAVHSSYDLPEKEQTRRLLRALDRPYVHILAHPLARDLSERPAVQADWPAVFAMAKERGVLLEVNGQPGRLDLDDVRCKMAKEMGLRFALSTDAHSPEDLENMRFAVWTARRGWLEPKDIANTGEWRLAGAQAK